MYSVVEIFKSLQGEGRFVGHPVNFVRLAGCSTGCQFCDTDIKERERLSSYGILKRLDPKYSKRVVITGGEPLEQELFPLVEDLETTGYKVHLETNGTKPIPVELFHWVSLSPKRGGPVKTCNWSKVNEVKWLVPEWSYGTIMEYIDHIYDPEIQHYVQPVNDKLSINQAALKEAIQYVEWAQGKLALSIQLHKVIGVR